MDDPDAALMQAVAAGEPAAMQMLVARKLPRLLALAVRMLGDRVEAEDVAQETFLRIWRHAGSFRGERARLDTWAHRIALNLCYDRLRRRREQPMAEPPDAIDPALRPDEALSEACSARRVERALQALAPRQREAIVLVYYQDMTNRQAAELMDVSVDALESLLSRGRRALAAILKGDDQ
ncbi:RNA polymerase sigma-70 factor [Xaviernesmea oryzae]|uniref:RNA polymerase sigma-70 factor n=1 Tax=Xaviernesmea oryzae TaxID=464029 RepID=A0A1Q9B385_9HYPH|nr:RNA polymerase sigma factor [Xaviernesmea oryzae]OLP62463.1 RNA polymerase sigma-70 factor [Xaviernesmea oryzae]SEM17256.1 RNA polymerase sigma-70 factor, ECF subfamily [Xaviernesmea oryzae]